MSAPQPRSARGGLGISATGHVALVTALLGLPLLWPLDLPPPLTGVTVMPGWPGLPPLEKGDHGNRPRVKLTSVRKETPSAVALLPDVAPEPSVAPTLEPQLPVGGGSSVAEPEPSTGESSSAPGDSSGVEGGRPEGGPGGLPGSCLDCAGGGVVQDYDRAPVLLRSVRPSYPPDAFVKKVEGTVRLEILIDATGRVAKTRVLDSIPMLDSAAVACVQQWRFDPARKQGRPVPTLAQAPVRFKIY